MITEFYLDFKYRLQQIKPEGFLAYEYNPLHNFRSSSQWLYDGNFLTKDKLPEDNIIEDNYNEKGMPLPPGTLLDLDTDKLQFSLEHPCNILTQQSYDGSVNLIISDNSSKLKLINSRFTALPSNRYKIVDRAGNLDTNLYDKETFDRDTSLYKISTTIPKIKFKGLQYGGNFKVGNYVFYFKLADSDDNESDFVGESGIVSCYKGNINYSSSIQGGVSDENSYKSIEFELTNIDTSFDYITIYYTRKTSDIEGIVSTTAYKLDTKFRISNSECNILLTGDEPKNQITLDDINIQFFLADKAKSISICQNRLFLGNVHKPTVKTELFKLCSANILPFYTSESAKTKLGDVSFVNGGSGLYCNVNNIYNSLGYWNTEIYRVGVVWILPDGSLSSVFGIRGIYGIPEIDNLDTDNSLEEIQQNYSKVNLTNLDYDNLGFIEKGKNNENINGILSIKNTNEDNHKVYSLGFCIPTEVIEKLKDEVIGCFFVRQKRIPTVLAQALIIGYDPITNLPCIPVGVNSNECELEAVVGSDTLVTHNFSSRKVIVDKGSPFAAICPEYELRQPYFNNIFTGQSFVIEDSRISPKSIETSGERFKYIYEYQKNQNYNNNNNNNNNEVKVIAVGDNVPLIRCDYDFRARAGEAEEAWKFREYNGKVIRGSYGPYLGLPNCKIPTLSIVNIRIPGYTNSELQYKQYFIDRLNDESPYYSISDRISIEDISNLNMRSIQESNTSYTTFYVLQDINRGDCFICNYTHRMNRNFQDPEAPNNDEIVDPKTWKDNYIKGDSEKNGKINRGDINAVKLGTWISFRVYSNYNISIRSIDDSHISESGLTGTPRIFYPNSAISVSGNYKIPESFILNTGLSSTVSERYNYLLPDVPYIKNEFGTRIVYSDIAINDAFKNGFRVFHANNYRDYPTTYGGIVKLVELYGNLLCVFEHGVALIPINERTVAGEGVGGNVYINTSNILPENPKMLSDMFGSQWQESIIKTPYYIYGVDTVAKKIWRTNGQTFEIISDFKIQKFLNDNITLTERELTPIIGIRNVKTHYNAFKGDVMFTFYDNLYGFEEKAWNICYNEVLQKWITLYSWIPSYSENIDNIFFSYNRNTSKWISKLGVCKASYPGASGITLDNPVFTIERMYAILGLANRELPDAENLNEATVSFVYSLEKSNFGFEKYFKIRPLKEVDGVSNESRVLKFTEELMKASKEELSVLSKSGDLDKYRQKLVTITNRAKQLANIEAETITLCYEHYKVKDEYGNIVDDKEKNYEELVNIPGGVIQLNIKAEISIQVNGNVDTDIKNYITGWNKYIENNQGYYQNTIAITSEDVFYNQMLTDEDKSKPNLSTDFWKHGQSGIIDIKEKIRPCYWYGEQHPFEFEFVVADKPGAHKIFSNLQIISNKAKPESFHYEIVGESYDWADDKENMYVRQEATKNLYQDLGSDILYDRRWKDLQKEKYVIIQNQVTNKNELRPQRPGIKCNPKSTIFPWYYERIDTFNDAYDSYQVATSKYGRDYQNLSGTEVIYDEQLNEFRLSTHLKARDMKEVGRLRGNCQYQEDLWLVEIPSINFMQKNENWDNMPPIVLNNIPNDLKQTEITQENIKALNAE